MFGLTSIGPQLKSPLLGLVNPFSVVILSRRRGPSGSTPMTAMQSGDSFWNKHLTLTNPHGLKMDDSSHFFV